MPLIRLPAFFPQQLREEEPVTFADLFRSVYQLNELADAARGHQEKPFAACQPRHHFSVRPRVFNPNFDVRETETTYELHGELPGINKENVHIEFTEPQTLTIRGRVERTYTSGTPPTESVDNTTEKAAALETGEEDTSTAPSTPTGSVTSHRATVSDEETETAKEKGEEPFTIISTETNQEAQAAKSNESNDTKAKPKPVERFWRQERSIGEFSRQFVFEDRIDEAAVRASLDNGILQVTVPKAPKRESRRIAIV